MAAGPPSFGFLAFVVAVVVIAAGVGGTLLYLHNQPKAPSSPLTIAVGDNVTVTYIGIFGSGPQEGKVFDTSLKAVADDNASYPKSLEYSPRNASDYGPLPVHVGATTPQGGYNVSGVSYLSVVTGFWKGLLGLAVNQTRWITVSPDQGYGPLVPACLTTGQLVQSIPAVVSITPKAFHSAYPNYTALAGSTFPDATYGWTDRVLSSNQSTVVLGRQPYLGETTAPYGWTIVVQNITSQTITLESQLSPASVGHVLGSYPGVKVCSASQFLVWSVDPDSGTFVENYNREVVGQTLIFVVTVVSILPP